MKNKKLLTNILFAVVVLAIAAVLLAVRSHLYSTASVYSALPAKAAFASR